jgi:GPH family glycoside/pentoside/hexuronide:cation symporter
MARIGFWVAIGQALHNRPFCILLASYTVVALGSNLPPVLLDYFAAYVLGRPDLAPYVLGGYFLAGMIAMPLWVWIAGRLGKKAAWLGAMLITVLPLAPVYAMGPGDVTAYLVASLTSGLGGVAVIALPASLQADVIDYDELQSGQRREGLFISLWSVAEKFAYAVGVGVALPAQPPPPRRDPGRARAPRQRRVRRRSPGAGTRPQGCARPRGLKNEHRLPFCIEQRRASR